MGRRGAPVKSNLQLAAAEHKHAEGQDAAALPGESTGSGDDFCRHRPGSFFMHRNQSRQR